jgi:cyclic nucleotide gated channel
VVGACWYMLAVERQTKCWSEVCSGESLCQRVFLDCFSLQSANPGRAAWLNSTVESANCSSDNFNYGIYQNAIDNNITSEVFLTRYFYSLWLGLLALRYAGSQPFPRSL